MKRGGPNQERTRRQRRSAARIIGVYVVVAALWIVCSDYLLDALWPQQEERLLFSILKGLAFVAITAALLWWLMRSEQQRELRRAARQVATTTALLEHFRELSAKVRDAVLLIDPSGKILEANDAAIALLGWPRHVLCSKRLDEVEVDPSGNGDKRRTAYYESIFRASDGRMLAVEVDALSLQLGTRMLRQLIIREPLTWDDTGAARRDRSWIDVFFDMPFIGMSITSPETRRWVRFNDRLCQMLGYSREEFRKLSWVEVTHPDDRDKDLAEFNRVLRGEIEGYQIEKRFIRKEGEVLHAEIDVRCRRFADGRVDYFVATVQDISEQVESQRRIREYVHRLERSMRGTVDAVTRMVDLRDPYTAGHEVRVGELAAAIGAELGLDPATCQGLSITGRLHDIGKITVPTEILAKPGRLSELEMNMVRTHAEQGFRILQGIEFDWPVAEVVRQHHERMDGSGYPRGLAGDDILMEARIMAVADVVESMASHRPYRAAKGLDLALAEIAEGAGVRYDSGVAAACIRLFREGRFNFST